MSPEPRNASQLISNSTVYSTTCSDHQAINKEKLELFRTYWPSVTTGYWQIPLTKDQWCPMLCRLHDCYFHL